jgi:hypothetical protein
MIGSLDSIVICEYATCSISVVIVMPHILVGLRCRDSDATQRALDYAARARESAIQST